MGFEIVLVDVPELGELVDEYGSGIVRELTLESERAIKLSMADGAPSGAKYQRGDSFHVASAPGQAPAIDSSNLINSIASEVTGMRGEITMNEYGIYLEEGTSRIEPRPFVVNSIEGVLQSLNLS